MTELRSRMASQLQSSGGLRPVPDPEPTRVEFNAKGDVDSDWAHEWRALAGSATTMGLIRALKDYVLVMHPEDVDLVQKMAAEHSRRGRRRKQ